VKHYSRDVLAQQLADVGWLDKVVGAMHRHWRIKNAWRLSRLAKSGTKKKFEMQQ
jgi:hypothetical protein